MIKFYDGTKILSLKDINGNDPEIYIITSNRSAGKTTFFSRYLVKRYLEHKEKFMIVYRWKREVSKTAAEKFFSDIKGLFFPEYNMTAESREKGLFYELYIGKGTEKGEPCGYVVAINSAYDVKKLSHLLSDTARMYDDEFVPEDGSYCPDEINKFQSLHKSVARGAGQMVRRVPVIMLSNTISLLNPYYTAWGVTDRIQTNTKFLRGAGWVLEQGFNEAAAEAARSSGFEQAFAGDKFADYQNQAVYLNDNLAFISRPSGKAQYFCTLKHEGENFGVRLYPELGLIYCDDRPDLTYHIRITTTTADHQVNYLLLKGNDYYLELMRWYFEKGIFRFKNLRCKAAVLSALKYRL